MLAQARERIIVALDVPSRKQAVALVTELADHVGSFKIGLELLISEGVGVVREIVDRGVRVLLDGKFHDIPNTVAGATKAATRLGVAMFTVHTTGGLAMLRAAVDAAKEEASRLGTPPPLVLGVTVLTSLDELALKDELGVLRKLEDQVVHLAKSALDAGLDGVVASPREVAAIGKLPGMPLVVTPGVRPIWSQAQDQQRVLTPAEAIQNGASYLVIGRPIIDPPAGIGTPSDAADRIAAEIQSALASQTRRP